MADQWWVAIAEAERRARFPGLQGARASVRLPLDDTLINRIIAEGRPADWPVRELTVRAIGRDELAIRGRPKVGWLPAIEIRVVIEQQPDLPRSPLLVLRIVSNPLTTLALAALRSRLELPDGLHLGDDRLTIDLAVLSRRYGFSEWLDLLTRLQLTTEPGRVVLEAEGAIPLYPRATLA